jgi:hypothetical protein
MDKDSKLKLVALIIGLFLSFIVAEIACRVYFFKGDALSYQKMTSPIKLGNSEFVKAAEDNEVHYDLKPDVSGYFKGCRFETNSFGCRDKNYSPEKPANTRRGIFIGDSFTMGSGIELEEVYHSKLEEILNNDNESRNFELINFGVDGYNLLSYLGVLRTKVLTFDPDFIVIGFCANNDFLLPSKGQLEGSFNAKPESGPSFFTSYFIGLINFVLFPPESSEEGNMKAEEEAFVGTMFKAFQDFSLTHDIPIFITYLSNRAPTKDVEKIRVIAKKNNLPFCDTSEAFKDTKLRAYRVSPFDAHPNGKANDLFVETLLSFEPLMELLQAED